MLWFLCFVVYVSYTSNNYVQVYLDCYILLFLYVRNSHHFKEKSKINYRFSFLFTVKVQTLKAGWRNLFMACLCLFFRVRLRIYHWCQIYHGILCWICLQLVYLRHELLFGVLSWIVLSIFQRNLSCYCLVWLIAVTNILT